MAMRRAGLLFLLLTLPTSQAQSMQTCPDDADADLCSDDDVTMSTCPDDPEADLCGDDDESTCPDDPDADLCGPDDPVAAAEPITTVKVEMDAAEAQKPSTFANVEKGCTARAEAVVGAGKGGCKVSVKLEKECSMVMETIPTGDVYKVLMKGIGQVDAGDAWAAGRSTVTRGADTFTKDTKVAAGRRLFEARQLAETLSYSIATTVTSAAELSSATSQTDPTFKTKLQSAMTSLASSAGVDAAAVAAAQPTSINPPTTKATVEMAMVATEAGLPADISSLQAQLGDTAALATSVNTAAGGTALVSEAKMTADKCAGRTCGGQGTCSDGVCTCNTGWSGANCGSAAATTTRAKTEEEPASLAAAGGLASWVAATAAAFALLH